MTLTLEPASPDAAYWLATGLCESDRRFVEALCPGGEYMLGEYLESSLVGSEQIFAIIDEGGVLQGLLSHRYIDSLFEVGEVTLLSSETLWEDHFREITRVFRRDVLPALQASYRTVQTTTRTKNTALLRWLIAAGFEPKRWAEFNKEQFTLLEIS